MITQLTLFGDCLNGSGQNVTALYCQENQQNFSFY